ncbi:MAG: hypothetical protein ABIJ61_04200, partial [bacterium]
MKRAFLIVAVALTVAGCGGEQPEQRTDKPIMMQSYDFRYNNYLPILSKYVVDGLVDYRGLQADRASLDSLVVGLAGANLSNATAEERLAFYINAYNMLT